MAKQKQRELELREKNTHGGKRKGAGRKRTSKLVAHSTRPEHNPNHALHITQRVLPEVGDLRELARLGVLKKALSEGCNRFGFRVVHFTIQSTHLHLLCEATSNEAITRGMGALKIRMARGLNALLDRTGAVFTDRFHVTTIKTPTQARYCIAYVLLNHRHHAAQHTKTLGPTVLDPCSSADAFEGWCEPPKRRSKGESVPVARPTTWLLRSGWRRAGLISPNEIPGARPGASAHRARG